MSPQKNFWLRHLSMWMSVYFLIANTSKVESNKMMQTNFKTFKIKVLVFIIIYLLSSLKIRGDTHIKCSYWNYTLSKLFKQAQKLKFQFILKLFL